VISGCNAEDGVENAANTASSAEEKRTRLGLKNVTCIMMASWSEKIVDNDSCICYR
jgi:hypothetical protein